MGEHESALCLWPHRCSGTVNASSVFRKKENGRRICCMHTREQRVIHHCGCWKVWCGHSTREQTSFLLFSLSHSIQIFRDGQNQFWRRVSKLLLHHRSQKLYMCLKGTNLQRCKLHYFIFFMEIQTRKLFPRTSPSCHHTKHYM